MWRGVVGAFLRVVPLRASLSRFSEGLRWGDAVSGGGGGKVRGLDLDALTAALQRRGVTLSTPVHQEDQAYAPSGWSTGESRIGVTFARLRLQDGVCLFTTKTPVDNVLACLEHETVVDDRDQMHQAVLAMGYR